MTKARQLTAVLGTLLLINALATAWTAMVRPSDDAMRAQIARAASEPLEVKGNMPAESKSGTDASLAQSRLKLLQAAFDAEQTAATRLAKAERISGICLVINVFALMFALVSLGTGRRVATQP